MKPPLVSFLLSSRKRPQSLRATVDSILATAARPQDLELVFRVCCDDPETLDVARSFFSRAHTRILVSWPLKGYGSFPFFVSEMAAVARGRWGWVLGDDVEMKGAGWDLELDKIPMTGHTVEPETTQLNTSEYKRVRSGPFPCIPCIHWRALPWYHPIDRSVETFLLDRGGWKPWFIPGLTLHHKNPPPETRQQERDQEDADRASATYLQPEY